jgi:hypothetical protein
MRLVAAGPFRCHDVGGMERLVLRVFGVALRCRKSIGHLVRD